MTSHQLFWLLLACWPLAAVAAVIKWALDALAADARNAKLPAGSLLSAVRTFIYCGAMFTHGVVFLAIAKTIDDIWDVNLKPFSFGLTGHNGSPKEAVISVGVCICLAMIHRLVERLLDKLLPIQPRR
jgi:hypothetical protein